MVAFGLGRKGTFLGAIAYLDERYGIDDKVSDSEGSGLIK
jgi:hypothetical protein